MWSPGWIRLELYITLAASRRFPGWVIPFPSIIMFKHRFVGQETMWFLAIVRHFWC